MNTPLKFDHERRPNLQWERSDFRAEYQDVATRTLVSVARHKKLIAAFVAAALVLAGLAISLMPRKYSAEALIYPNLFAREQGKVVALASVDAATIVNGEARLIRSEAFLRSVVQRLGLDNEAATPGAGAQIVDWLRGMLLPETRNYSPFDRSVELLRNKVSVMNDTRSYIISISFTASSPEEATRVVNAFAMEYIRDKSIQRRLDAVTVAEAELERQLAIYGEKHPKASQAAEGVETARAALVAAKNPDTGTQDAVMTDESVKLAVPNRTPTSPKGLVILGLSFLLALMAGIGLAFWRERRDYQHKIIVGFHPHPP